MTRRCLAPLALALLLLPAAAVAQQEPIGMVQVNLLEIKPGMVDQFRDVHLDVFMPAQKESGTPWRTTTQTVLGTSFEFAVATPIENYAALDEPTNLASIPETMREMALDAWADSVASRRSFIVQARPDLSMEPQPMADLSRRVRIEVPYGRVQEFEELWVKDVLPALAKSGAKGYQVFQSVLGGNVAEYWGILPMKNYAMLDSWSPFSGLSAEDGAKLRAKMAEVMHSIEIDITELDRELTYGRE